MGGPHPWLLSGYLDTGIHSPALDGEREGVAPVRDLLLELVDASNLAAGDLEPEVLQLVSLLGQLGLHFLADLDALINVLGHALEVSLAKSAAGHGWGADTQTTRGKSALVAGHCVLVAGDVDLLEKSLNTGAIEFKRAEIDQHHVRVGAVRHKRVAELLELVLQSLGVVNHLLLVLLELGGSSLLEGDSKGGDGVVVGTALVAGEDGEVDPVLQVIERLLASLGVNGPDALAEEDHGTARATERLVGGGGDDIGVLERRGDNTGGNKAGNVGNVDDQVGANRVGDLAHALVVNQTEVSRGTGNKNLGTEELGILLERVVVDDAGREVDTVRHGLEVS